ncbi:MAG: peptide chain release factor N(5)-glutamine methyltransferase [Candidatus Pelagibacter bacterium]|nr:peptide chain release factor N(5)-glutamine methyltransferase [Candidatus Pelagibacter bacterium]MBL6861061.1 peptide chain release factor N(5)-glutamine methyltransferase [Candidatus Pelagibacter bacterium]
MNTLEAIKFGSNLLKEKKIQSYILDSELLLSKTLNKSREKILTNLDVGIKKKNFNIFKDYLIRRSKNEPIAYIFGEKEFWSKSFNVNKHTLIPRPETELLVDELLKIFKGKKISILDIGTGSGCIIVSLLSDLGQSIGTGVDVSKSAILMAKKNAKKYKLTNRIKFLTKSFENIFDKKFDLIVSNPPYIERNAIKNLSEDIKKYEPRMALDGGNDGLDLIKKVIYKSKYILKINGALALEIGNEQIKKVSKILADNNFRAGSVIKDYKNNIRCIIAYKK